MNEIDLVFSSFFFFDFDSILITQKNMEVVFDVDANFFFVLCGRITQKQKKKQFEKLND